MHLVTKMVAVLFDEKCRNMPADKMLIAHAVSVYKGYEMKL